MKSERAPHEPTLREQAREKVDREYQNLSFTSWAMLWGKNVDDALRNVRRMGREAFLKRERAMLEERVDARMIVLHREQKG